MQVCLNGLFYSEDEPLLPATNRCFKYGDGLFETAKMYNGKLVLEALHMARLLQGLHTLQIDVPYGFTDEVIQKVTTLAQRNNCSASGRVRVAVYRTHENNAAYLAEAIPLAPDVNNWQPNGLHIGLYTEAVKPVDAFSNLKSAAYLPYIMAARFGSAQGFNDVLLLNTGGAIADSSRANVFIVKNNCIHTPALHQGCIAGVMRQHLLTELPRLGYAVSEGVVTEDDLLQADEIFLTNAIQTIRWVAEFSGRQYDCKHSRRIFQQLLPTILL